MPHPNFSVLVDLVVAVTIETAPPPQIPVPVQGKWEFAIKSPQTANRIEDVKSLTETNSNR